MFDIGKFIAVNPARLMGIVKISDKYISNALFTFSPISKAVDGAVGKS